MAAYRTHELFGLVLRATHPSSGSLDVVVTDEADADLLGLVTVAAIGAGMGVCVFRADPGAGAHLRAVEQVLLVARVFELAGRVSVSPLSTTVRWDREGGAA